MMEQNEQRCGHFQRVGCELCKDDTCLEQTRNGLAWADVVGLAGGDGVIIKVSGGGSARWQGSVSKSKSLKNDWRAGFVFPWKGCTRASESLPPRPTDAEVGMLRRNGRRVELTGECGKPNGRLFDCLDLDTGKREGRSGAGYSDSDHYNGNRWILQFRVVAPPAELTDEGVVRCDKCGFLIDIPWAEAHNGLCNVCVAAPPAEPQRKEYHGGCIGCNTDQKLCKDCCYMKADWRKPDLNLSHPVVKPPAGPEPMPLCVDCGKHHGGMTCGERAVKEQRAKPVLPEHLWMWELTEFGEVPQGQPYLTYQYEVGLYEIIGIDGRPWVAPSLDYTNGHRWHACAIERNGLTWAQCKEQYGQPPTSLWHVEDNPSLQLGGHGFPQEVLKAEWLAGHIHRADPVADLLTRKRAGEEAQKDAPGVCVGPEPAQEPRYGIDHLTVAEALAQPRWALEVRDSHGPKWCLLKGVWSDDYVQRSFSQGRIRLRRCGEPPMTWGECEMFWADGALETKAPSAPHWVKARIDIRQETLIRWWQAGEVRRRVPVDTGASTSASITAEFTPDKVPDDFTEALADYEAGRSVPLDVALSQPPPVDAGGVVPTLHEDLTAVLNKHGYDDYTETPDFILATFIVDMLDDIQELVTERAAHLRCHCNTPGTGAGKEGE